MTGRSPRHLTKPSCLLNIGEAGLLTPPTQFAPIHGYRLVYQIGFLRRWYFSGCASVLGPSGPDLLLYTGQHALLPLPSCSCLSPKCPTPSPGSPPARQRIVADYMVSLLVNLLVHQII